MSVSTTRRGLPLKSSTADGVSLRVAGCAAPAKASAIIIVQRSIHPPRPELRDNTTLAQEVLAQGFPGGLVLRSWSIAAAFAMLLAGPALAQSSQWSVERANAWYAAQRW